MKITDNDIGKQCQVWYDDCGSCTGMIVEEDTDTLSVYFFERNTVDRTVEAYQVLSIGERIKPIPPKNKDKAENTFPFDKKAAPKK